MFHTTDGPSRILKWFLSFYLPHYKYSHWSAGRKALWGRECMWLSAGEDRNTKIFCRARDRTPAACMAGWWFINCAMPLRQNDISWIGQARIKKLILSTQQMGTMSNSSNADWQKMIELLIPPYEVIILNLVNLHRQFLVNLFCQTAFGISAKDILSKRPINSIKPLTNWIIISG